MQADKPVMTEEETAARREALAAVRQTRLGRALLSALGKAQVKIVFKDHIDSGDENTRIYGLYDSRINTLFVDARAPLHAQLHFFAHEARHALQMHEEVKLNAASEGVSINLISPVTQLYLTRLREMDADVFAVHFVAQHDLHTGSNHFGEMNKRSGFFFQDDTYNRAGLYGAFLDRWLEQGRPRDMSAAAQAVAVSFMQNTALLNTYNNFALHVWEKTTGQAMEEHAQKPHSQYHKDFRALALAKETAQKPRDIFNARAAVYGKILVRSGGPDYLKDVAPEALCKHVCESNTQADPWYTTNYGFERAIEKFNRAVAHYRSDPPSAHNDNPLYAPVPRAAKPGP